MNAKSDSLSKWFYQIPLEDNKNTDTSRKDFDKTSYEMLKDIQKDVLKNITYCTDKFKQIDNEISDINEKNIPEENYFRVAGILNSIALFVIIISPIVIILSILIIFSYYSDNEKIFDYALYIVGLIGAGGLMHAVKSYNQMKSINADLNEISIKVNNLEKEIKKWYAR